MADVKPTSAAPVAAAPVVTLPVTPVEATLTSIPENLQQLVRQVQATGTVTAPPTVANASVTISTAAGDFTLSLAQLPQAEQQKIVQQLLSLFESQKPLTLIVPPGSPPDEAILLLPQTGNAAAAGNVSSVAQTTPAFSPIPLTVGTNLTAIVLPPAASVALTVLAANDTATVASPQGSALPQQSLSPTPTSQIAAPATGATNALPASPLPLPAALAPAAANGPPQTTSPPGPPLSILTEQAPSMPPTQPVALPPVSGESTSAPVSLLQSGQQVSLQIDRVFPSGGTPPAAGPNQIVATVTGTGPNGQTILQAGDIELYVRQPLQAAAGTQVLLTVQPPEPSLLPITLTSSDEITFNSLQQLVGALAQIDPGAARQLIEASIPQPAAQMSSGMLLFLNMLKQGDTHGLVGGNAAEILNAVGKFELISRLHEDVRQAGGLVRDSIVGEWRSYPVPVFAEGQLQSMQLFVHQDRDREGSQTAAQNGPGSVRFLVDVHMTRLGPLQLDGLVLPKKLDMIVRSETALPPGLHQDLRDTYIRTLDALGYSGGLSFQAGRQHWMIMNKEGTSREA